MVAESFVGAGLGMGIGGGVGTVGSESHATPKESTNASKRTGRSFIWKHPQRLKAFITPKQKPSSQKFTSGDEPIQRWDSKYL